MENQKIVGICPECKKVSLVYNPPILRPEHYYCNECGKSFGVKNIVKSA